MTAAEQAALLRATAAHPEPRDHILYSMSLGTGLRLAELLGLNVGAVSPDGRVVRARVTLVPATTKGRRRGEVFLPARLIPKLRRFLAWKREHAESVDPDAPLFVSGQGRRLSKRAAQWRFAWWQARAGLDRRYNFHALQHSAVTNVYRASKNRFLAQRFARHVSPLTTIIYTHPADEPLAGGAGSSRAEARGTIRPMEQPLRPLTLRVQQVSKLLNVGRSTIYDWIAGGRLPSIRIGDGVLVSCEDLDAFLAEHRQPGRRWSAGRGPRAR